jgi:hypothetical protein
MQAIDQRIATLEEKLKQAKNKKKLLEARKNRAASKVDRAKDTRRKILVGAFFMEQVLNNQEMAQRFYASLTRENDRELFGLVQQTKREVA